MKMRTWKADDDAEEESNEPQIISIGRSSSDVTPVGNKIYFYKDISKDSILTLNRQIDEISRNLKIIQYTFNLPTPPAMEIHICSDGGDVFASISAVDKIINSDIPIHTYCEGIVASAATLISCAGHKRFITKNSCMLIHQVSGGLWGNYAEFQDEMKNLELIMNIIKGVYIKKTSFQPDKLNEILSHDLYMSAEDCQKNGLVDIIN